MNTQAEIDRLNSKLKRHENRLDEIDELVRRWCLDRQAESLCGKTSIDDLWGYTQRVAMTIHKNRKGHFEVIAGCEEYFRKYAPPFATAAIGGASEGNRKAHARTQELHLELRPC